MHEYTEGLFVIAVYVFTATAFALPPALVYLFIKISKIIIRATKILDYAEDGEQESKKYHE